MIVFPAIDLKGGEVVRLAEGDMDRATVYGDDPAAQVRTRRGTSDFGGGLAPAGQPACLSAGQISLRPDQPA